MGVGARVKPPSDSGTGGWFSISAVGARVVGGTVGTGSAVGKRVSVPVGKDAEGLGGAVGNLVNVPVGN